MRVQAFGYQPADTTLQLQEDKTAEWNVSLRAASRAIESVSSGTGAVRVGPSREQYAGAAATGGIDSVAIGRVSLDTTLAFDFATFGIRLLSTRVRKAPDSTHVVSPLSAGQALALAMSASKDSTTTVMAQGLAVGEMDHATLAKRMQWFNRSLAGRKDLAMSMGNALWVDTSETLQPDFVSLARGYYDASVRTIGLRSREAVSAINRWADSATSGRIKRVRDKAFDDSVKVVLTNALYLKANWLTPFEKKQTKEVHFTTANGRRVKVPMMHGGGRLAYRRARGAQVVRLPYRAGLTAMYIVLPDEGVPVAGVLDSLERYGWPVPDARKERRDVALAIPRFRVEQRTDLIPPLTAMGMGIMFDKHRADFGGLLVSSPKRPPPCPPLSNGISISECTRVRVSDATQNVLLDVDEVGTEAAAVTVLAFEVVVVSAGPPPIPFVADRPFLFAIRDERTGTLLFTGYVANPKR